MKTITKTSKQAQLEKSLIDAERTCLECSRHAFGFTVSKMQGFFSLTRLKQTKYSCFGCGCKWETDWK